MSRYRQCPVSLVGVLVCVPSIVLINGIGWTFVCLFTQLRGGQSVTAPAIGEFFPQVKSDMSLITWGHGVNSRSLLQKSLLGSDMMIEADVSLGTLVDDDNGVGNMMAIMAHPPFKTSDLSLEEFLDTILRSNLAKGIKLDFKDIEVVQPALDIIKSRADQINVPLWLNADIIAGPVDSTVKPLEAATFLNLAKRYFPNAVLSVGWTTRFGPDVTKWPLKVITDGHYTMDHVRQLRDALVAADIQQPVSFPIRAGLSTSAESQDNIVWLLDQVYYSTLTIWSGIYDTVDVPALMKLIDRVGRHRIFIDVPDGLQCQIRHFHDVQQ